MRAPEFARKFTEGSFGKMSDWLNSLFQNGVTLDDNMSGEVIEVTLPTDGTEIQVPHRLKCIPKYRIILRQDNYGVIFDGEESWNDKYITLRCEGELTDLTSVTFPGGTYVLNTSGTATTTIPPTACTVTTSSPTTEITVKFLLMRG